MRAAGVDGGATVIPNVTRGGNMRGLLLYLVGAGKREEHENPHLVAGSPEAIWLAGERPLRARTRSRWPGFSMSRARRSGRR